MSYQRSALEFFNQETGGEASSYLQGYVNYMNSVMGSDYRNYEVASKAYWEFLKVNPPTPISSTDVVVSDGDTLDADDGGTIAVSVANGVATYTYTAPAG